MSELTPGQIARLDLALRFMVSEFKRVGYVQNDDDAPMLSVHLCHHCGKPTYVGLRCLQCGNADDTAY